MPRPEAFRKPLLDLPALLDAGLVAGADAAPLAAVAQGFPIRIAPAIVQAMQGQPDSPVARQFLPALAELDPGEGALFDPIGDEAHAPVPGLTHRYPDRVILHVTRTCDVHCRFCFRREVVGGSGPLPETALAAALAYIATRPAIREVILTGGDPLTLSPRRISDIARRLAAINHVEVLRLHSRGPVVTPERITPALIAAREGVSGHVACRAHQPRGRIDRRGPCGAGATGAGRGAAFIADRFAAGRERQRRGTGIAVSRPASRQSEALLFAPLRSCARGGAFSHHDWRGPRDHGRLAGAVERHCPAPLCDRHSRRLWQSGAE